MKERKAPKCHSLAMKQLYNPKYRVECAAVDALVKLTKGNVDVSHSTIFPAQIGM